MVKYKQLTCEMQAPTIFEGNMFLNQKKNNNKNNNIMKGEKKCKMYLIRSDITVFFILISFFRNLP